jgi:hypothetical protein
VLGGITDDLNSGIYAGLGGELAVRFSASRKDGAFASSRGAVSEPPQHSVTFEYWFVKQLWLDSEGFCLFLRAIPVGTDVDKLYDQFTDKSKLPEIFTSDEQTKNLFLAALTWIYFHEIGHLVQEHREVRRAAIHSKEDDIHIHEFHASADEPLIGYASVVSHTTELAADFEATTLVLQELVRHILEEDFVPEAERADVFGGLFYLMVCAQALVFHRFNGRLVRTTSEVPHGSHPDPLTRLEINVPHMFEVLDQGSIRESVNHQLDRAQLVAVSAKACLSASLYWSITHTEERQFNEEFLVKGLLTKPETLRYLQPIVKCWDDISPKIQKNRRFGSPLGLLSFNKIFRERIEKVIPWGEGPEDETPPLIQIAFRA